MTFVENPARDLTGKKRQNHLLRLAREAQDKSERTKDTKAKLRWLKLATTYREMAYASAKPITKEKTDDQSYD